VEGLRWISCDLSSAAGVQAVVGEVGPEVCFHLAWRAEPGEYLSNVGWNFESIRMGLDIVEALLDSGCRRIVCAGSCAEYELGTDVLAETSPVRPRTLYGAAKLALGTAATSAAAVRGAALAWARIFYVHGPFENPRRAVPRIVDRVLAGADPGPQPAQLKDFLHVSDVASALVALAAHGVHGPVNVCSGQPTSLAQIAGVLVELGAATAPAAPPAPARPPAAPRSAVPPELPIIGNPATLHRLGWRPRYDLTTGLADTLQWWGQQRQPTP